MRFFALILLAACGGQEAPADRTPDAPAVATGDHAESTRPAADAPLAGGEWAQYGAALTQTAAPLSADALLQKPEQYVGQTVVVEGTVSDVCQKAGCWMVISDSQGQQTMRVLMKDHAFAVDKQGAGSTCQIEGVVEARPIDPATVAHFESESAEKGAMPEKKAEGGVVYQIQATGVRMKKGA